MSKKLDINGIVDDAYQKAFDAVYAGVGDDMLAVEYILRELGRRYVETAQALEAARERAATPEYRQRFERMVERAEVTGKRMPTAQERMDNLAKIISEGEESKREGWTEQEIKDALLKSARQRSVQ